MIKVLMACGADVAVEARNVSLLSGDVDSTCRDLRASAIPAARN